jgi:D-aminopeptidase
MWPDKFPASEVGSFAERNWTAPRPHATEARHLLTAEISPCVEGCLDGGATVIIVNDGHGGGLNIVPEELHPGASYFTGVGRPERRNGMDESVDGLILLGYHAMNGAEDGVLHSTQSSLSEAKHWYNGVESGEIAQTALGAGCYNIQPIMYSGDLRGAEEARRFLGEEIITVVVKEGLSRTSSIMLAPVKARGVWRNSERAHKTRGHEGSRGGGRSPQYFNSAGFSVQAWRRARSISFGARKPSGKMLHPKDPSSMTSRSITIRVRDISTKAGLRPCSSVISTRAAAWAKPAGLTVCPPTATSFGTRPVSCICR